MVVKDLKGLYLHGIKDLHSACKQAAPVVDEMAKAAKHADLKQALEAGASGTRKGMEQMAELARKHGEEPGGEHCKGMEGLVAEARKHALEESYEDDDTRDAAIIAQYQRMAHYAITGYGTSKAFAKRLKLDEDVAVLDQCTRSGYEGDETMTRIAEQGVNAAAMN